MPRLILASSSPYRRELLQRLGLPFTCISPDIDETGLLNEGPEALVRRLARGKVDAIAKMHQDAIIIGSDQVASIGKSILTKPGNSKNALAQLQLCSGNTVTFYTSLHVLDGTTGQQYSTVEPFVVGFRELQEAQILRYIELEQPFDCAGSFKCEGLGITLFTHLSGRDPNALVGLPLIELTGMLQQLGVDPLGPQL